MEFSKPSDSNVASSPEMTALISKIEEFQKEKPKIEAELNQKREELNVVLNNLNEIKSKVKENKQQLFTVKNHLQEEKEKKKELEKYLLELEQIIDSGIKGPQKSFDDPEEYKEYKVVINLKL